jgi:hypothetical protein
MLTKKQLRDLGRYIAHSLGDPDHCKDDLRLTSHGLMVQRVKNSREILAWLSAQGIDCDCEVFFTLCLDDELAFDLMGPSDLDADKVLIQIFAAYVVASPADKSMLRSRYAERRLPFDEWDRIPTA